MGEGRGASRGGSEMKSWFWFWVYLRWSLGCSRKSGVACPEESKCGSSREASAEVTRVIGGRVGGRDEEWAEGGRSSELSVDSCWALSGEKSRDGCCSGIGEVGFDEPRRWKRRWDSIVIVSYEIETRGGRIASVAVAGCWNTRRVVCRGPKRASVGSYIKDEKGLV